MKKVLILLSTIFMSGCFVCHKTSVDNTKILETAITEELILEEKIPVAEEKVILRHSIPNAANFNFDSKDILPDKNKLDEVDADIKANPEALILVEGHTDDLGSDAYNKQLSIERARSVAQEIAKRGYPNPIRVYGAGKNSPIASNETEQGRAQNRRVDVVLVRE